LNCFCVDRARSPAAWARSGITAIAGQGQKRSAYQVLSYSQVTFDSLLAALRTDAELKAADKAAKDKQRVALGKQVG
jgi:hypothetical protein